MVVTIGGGLLTASGGQRPGMPLTTLRCRTAHDREPTIENDSVQTPGGAGGEAAPQ